MNHTAAFFSIVIPTYNRADKIPRAIYSLLEQTFADYEIIVVDDGSTDNTEEVVKQIKDDRIRYFKKVNEERNIARNFGINKANGKYVGFLDSDDYCYSNHLSVAKKLIEDKEQPEIIHLGYEVKYEDESIIYKKNSLSININDELIWHNSLSCNGIFIRTDIIKKYQFLQSRNAVVGEDHYLWLRLAARYPIYCDNTITSVIIEHKERSLQNLNPERLAKGFEEILLSLTTDSSFAERYKQHLPWFIAHKYAFISLIFSINKRKKESVNYLLKSLQVYPLAIFSRRVQASIKHLLFT